MDVESQSATTGTEDADKFEYLRHTTISQDYTLASQSERGKLAVLQERDENQDDTHASEREGGKDAFSDHIDDAYDYTEPDEDWEDEDDLQPSDTGGEVRTPQTHANSLRRRQKAEIEWLKRKEGQRKLQEEQQNRGRRVHYTVVDGIAPPTIEQPLEPKQPVSRAARPVPTIPEEPGTLSDDSDTVHSVNSQTASYAKHGVSMGTFLPSKNKERRKVGRQKKKLRVDDLDKKIFELQRLRDSLKSTTFQVFHIIGKEDTIYLAPPSWRLAHDDEDIATLVGHSPLADEKSFLKKRPDIAFAVYKEYISEYQSREVSDAAAMGTVLPDPDPVGETIKLVSDQMRDAMDEFQRVHPAFEENFPQWHSRMPIPSPFLFWYRFRQSSKIEEMAEHHQRQIRLLTDWIEHHYRGVYADAEHKFRHGKVSSSTMPFLVQPGDVLVKRGPEGLVAYVAESWANFTSIDSNSDYVEPLHAKGGTHVKNVEKWQVKAWNYKYDGHFKRSTTDLQIVMEFDEEDSDVELKDLNVLPLRFAHADVRDQLVRRGRIMWACRRRRLVTYHSSLENDPLGESERYMIDFKTYTELHPDSKGALQSPKGHHPVIDDRAMDSDEPPQEPDLLVLPNTLIGYNLRQKKWSEYTVNLSISKA
jgi:hypothetical protein